MQAICCKLAGIKPPKDRSLYTTAVDQQLLLFSDRQLTAVVKVELLFVFTTVNSLLPVDASE
jgi:hypothetical protein